MTPILPPPNADALITGRVRVPAPAVPTNTETKHTKSTVPPPRRKRKEEL